MPFLYYAILFLLLLVGMAITVMTLPGLWLMLASTALYAWLTHWQYISWKTLLTLLVLSALGEVVELAFSAGGARQSGAGRRGTWGALIGGLLGGLFLSFLPLWPVSTLVGVCLGTFLGALIGELSGGREFGHSAIVGVGAAKGRLMGTLAKVAIGGIMLAITLWIALPLPSRTHKTSAPQLPPTTTTAPSVQ
jgi:uncharacterized protein YqgC (DUF456 family)